MMILQFVLCILKINWVYGVGWFYEALASVSTTHNCHYAKGPTSPFCHWYLQRHIIDQNSRYADIWAEKPSLLGVSAGNPLCPFIFSEALTTTYVSHGYCHVSHRTQNSFSVLLHMWPHYIYKFFNIHTLIRMHKIRYQSEL